MKFLLLTTNSENTGGIEQFNKNLIRAFSDLNHTIKTVELKNTSLLNKILFSAKSILSFMFFRPSVVLYGHVNFSPICLFLKKFFKADYFIFTHGIDVWELESKTKEKALLKANRIITVSNFTKESIINQINSVRDKIFLLPNTVDGQKFKPKSKPRYLVNKHNLENKKVIFTLARLSKEEGYKGYDKVIEALPHILNELPETVYIIGGKGDDRNRIKNLIREKGVKDNVILAGFIPDDKLIDYYNLADVFAMPSKKEGFGIVFLEALSCGTPVLAGNKDGSVDALQNGETGFLVDPEDVNKISKSLLNILKRENESNKLYNSDYLREKTLNAYSFDRFKEKCNKLINEHRK